ncbi:MAG: SpoIIE family protein phosphatase [Microscillaceae bacterium]|jgi:serine phosphatase RsbU (regulator of sigma subunit)|nr:SpoIIE family protein phosphatase [Microscillaceae bacterium]
MNIIVGGIHLLLLSGMAFYAWIVLGWLVLLAGLIWIFTDLPKRKNQQTLINNLQKHLADKDSEIERQQTKMIQLKADLQTLKSQLEVQTTTIEKQSQALQKHGKQLITANVDLSTYQEEIEQQRKIIERQSRDTIDSILYAQHIQEAMLPKIDQIKKTLPESFVFYRPRDIVSGDFYWFNTKSHRTIIGAVDCTGHGVPGAFLSMIGNELLNKIVVFKGISEPDKILNQLHLEIRHTLKQKETANEDGMDIALVAIHQVPQPMWGLFGKPYLEFAGAKNSLLYIQNNEMHEIKGDKVPIGGFLYEEEHRFQKHIVDISTPTTFYIYSDGFQDQFGGPEKRKFMVPRFRRLLFDMHQKPMGEQKNIIEDTLLAWMGEARQMDDILIIGVKLNGVETQSFEINLGVNSE